MGLVQIYQFNFKDSLATTLTEFQAFAEMAQV